VIWAHASRSASALLTLDRRVYRAAFPELEILVPEALHKKSGLGTRDGRLVLNKPPLLAVACNLCASPVPE
jgi:hypothetical protein